MQLWYIASSTIILVHIICQKEKEGQRRELIFVIIDVNLYIHYLCMTMDKTEKLVSGARI